jgi:transposase-like protein
VPWTSSSIFEARCNFVMLALSPNSNIQGLCRLFNISPQTGYRTLERYRAEGEKGIVLTPLTAGRSAVPRPLNLLFFACVRTTPRGAVENCFTS